MRAGKLETALCELHGREHAVLFGNGTTAIVAALRALGVRGAGVAIPNGVCYHVPLAVIHSGNTPHYLDIDPDDFGLSPPEVASACGLGAVIGVHSYGNACRLDLLRDLCRAGRAPLIEDLAPAHGARLHGELAGAFGDVAIVSFGAGKILDCGHGGALLCDDPSLASEARRVAEQSVLQSSSDAARAAALGKRHTALYNASLSTGLSGRWRSFHDEAVGAMPSLLSRFDERYASPIGQALARLPHTVEVRGARWRKLRDALSRLPASWLHVCRPPEGSVPWRLNALLPNGRDSVLKHLLSQGVKISSWFPPVDQFFRERDPTSHPTPVSDRVGAQILNFWVNEEVDADYCETVTRGIEHALGSAV